MRTISELSEQGRTRTRTQSRSVGRPAGIGWDARRPSSATRTITLLASDPYSPPAMPNKYVIPLSACLQYVSGGSGLNTPKKFRDRRDRERKNCAKVVNRSAAGKKCVSTAAVRQSSFLPSVPSESNCTRHARLSGIRDCRIS